MKSKISKVNDKQKTARTIIPQPVIEMMNLKYGDYILWKPEINENKITFYITKEE